MDIDPTESDMRKIALSIGALGVLSAAALCTVPAHATGSTVRTWVANYGNGSACTETDPCNNFAAALLATAPGGEIDCLTPSDYGNGSTLAISQSVTINCGDFVGGITGPSDSPAITISGPSPSNVVVVLKSLFIDGAGVATDGIDVFEANTVALDNVTIANFPDRGIVVECTSACSLPIANSYIYQNGGVGILMDGASGSSVLLQNTTVAQNKFGIATVSGNGWFVLSSLIADNTSAGLETNSGANGYLDATTVVGNGIGLETLGGPISFNNSNIAGNGTAISGTTYSYGNNRIFGNSSAGTTPTRVNLE
jgi:Right handed beta helix region